MLTTIVTLSRDTTTILSLSLDAHRNCDSLSRYYHISLSLSRYSPQLSLEVELANNIEVRMPKVFHDDVVTWVVALRHHIISLAFGCKSSLTVVCRGTCRRRYQYVLSVGLSGGVAFTQSVLRVDDKELTKRGYFLF